MRFVVSEKRYVRITKNSLSYRLMATSKVPSTLRLLTFPWLITASTDC